MDDTVRLVLTLTGYTYKPPLLPYVCKDLYEELTMERVQMRGRRGTLLHKYVKEHNIPKIEHVLRYKVNVNATDDDWLTVLMIAMNRSYYDIAELLVEHPKLNVNQRDSDRRSLLYIAIRQNMPHIALRLLERGADPSHVDEMYIPFHSACARGFLDVAKVILRKGISVDVEDARSQTALFKLRYSHPEVERFLIDNGANPNHLDFDGKPYTYYQT